MPQSENTVREMESAWLADPNHSRETLPKIVTAPWFIASTRQRWQRDIGPMLRKAGRDPATPSEVLAALGALRSWAQSMVNVCDDFLGVGES